MFPILAPLLRSPGIVWIVGGACAVLVAVRALGFTLWHCPTKETFGIDCPGCGMTRATGALLGGRFEESWALHPFAGVFVALGLAAGIGSLLKEERRERLAQRVERVERRTGFTLLPLAAFFIYGMVRMVSQL